MQWHDHYQLKDKHAFLSPSSYHWINYDEERLKMAYINNENKQKGTALHAFAEFAIRNKIKLASHKKALNMFVNDAIGFDMQPEQTLYYSDNCFGTTDAILFENQVLRVHDLKTGISKPSFNQLYVYCALFCLEYNIKPSNITFICRIYQFSGYEEVIVDYTYIDDIMSQIVACDRILDSM